MDGGLALLQARGFAGRSLRRAALGSVAKRCEPYLPQVKTRESFSEVIEKHMQD
jgi:hypothetical protein